MHMVSAKPIEMHTGYRDSISDRGDTNTSMIVETKAARPQPYLILKIDNARIIVHMQRYKV